MSQDTLNAARSEAGEVAIFSQSLAGSSSVMLSPEAASAAALVIIRESIRAARIENPQGEIPDLQDRVILVVQGYGVAFAANLPPERVASYRD